VLQPSSLTTPAAIDLLEQLAPYLVLVIAYGIIIPQKLLDIPKYGWINLHASILPRWRGAAPIEHSILAGDTTSGITVMQMNAKMDAGDILATYPCQLARNETCGSLYDKLTPLAQNAAVDSLQNLPALQANAQTQDPALITFAPKIVKASTTVNWAQPAQQIEQLIRALHPKPAAHSTIGNISLKIMQACVVQQPANASPGTIINISKDGILVSTTDQCLQLQMLQFPGKKPLTIKELLNAKYFNLHIGNKFW